MSLSAGAVLLILLGFLVFDLLVLFCFCLGIVLQRGTRSFDFECVVGPELELCCCCFFWFFGLVMSLFWRFCFNEELAALTLSHACVVGREPVSCRASHKTSLIKRGTPSNCNILTLFLSDNDCEYWQASHKAFLDQESK